MFWQDSNKPTTYGFDRVFGPETSQLQVFSQVSQLIESALDGYNVCIFAYGQTGAGRYSGYYFGSPLKLNLSLHLLYCAEEYNVFAGPSGPSLQHSSFWKMLQRWRVVADYVSVFTDTRCNLRFPSLETNMEIHKFSVQE